MADTKISALTGATTPLAGTEVLPIVQGGSTVKVSVANLTAGRAVVTAALTATGIVSTSDVTQATSTTAASVTTAGGLGVAKKAYFGDTINGTSAVLSGTVGTPLLSLSAASYARAQQATALAANTSLASTSTVNSGMILVRNGTDGGSGLFLLDDAVGSVLVSQVGTIMSATDTGASSSKICVLYSPPGTLIIYNRYATAKYIFTTVVINQGG
jgi:hypothetical protein